MPAGAQSPPDLGFLFSTCHNTRSPRPRHRAAPAGRGDHQQPGLAHSGFRSGSAARVPAEPPGCARSAGFKTDPVPLPARVPPPPQIRGGGRLRRNFSQSGVGHPGRLGFAERGSLWTGETPPTSFSSLLRPTPRAPSLAAGGMGSPKELRPGKARAAALLDPKSGRGNKTKLFLKREEEQRNR